MRVIGLIGGVGAGKSRILEFLEREYGARVIQTDQVAKGLEEKGQEVYGKILEAFGEEILDPDGQIDRGRLAAEIFSREKALERINGIVHPAVWRKVREMAWQSAASLVVVESALPGKNQDDFFDEVWYVYTLEETRMKRLMETRGYSRERCARMIASQPSEEEYRAAADWVFCNDGSFEKTEEEIRERLKRIELAGLRMNKA